MNKANEHISTPLVPVS